MKKSILLLGFFIFLAAMPDASAQLSRKEKKEWKKKQKRMDPEEFKNLIEEKSSLEAKVSSMNGQLTSIQSKLSDKETQVEGLQNQVASLETQIQANKAGDDAMIDVSSNKTRSSKGVIFRVQIGAFKDIDLSAYTNKGESFNGEEADGVQKYTLGSFTDYWEADTFKKYLREMGVKKAWIVPYKDGLRVPLKEVLEGVIAQKQ